MAESLSTIFDEQLAVLRSRPAHIRFEVPDHMFRDIESMEKAKAISQTMERFKHNAFAAGYEVMVFSGWDKADPGARSYWIYDLVLREPQKVRPTLGTEAIDV